MAIDWLKMRARVKKQTNPIFSLDNFEMMILEQKIALQADLGERSEEGKQVC